MLLPGLGEQNISARLRLTIALILAAVLLPLHRDAYHIDTSALGPVVVLLVLVDFALALLGRLNQQLQLLSLAFPAKMLTALVVLSWVTVLFPRILMQFSGQAWSAARRMLGI